MEQGHEPLIDWARLGRRVGITAAVLGGLSVVLWLVTGVAGDGVRLSGLFAWIGGALLAMFVAEVVIVGGSAVRAMLRAGERGERLARGDVGMLPPQLTGRRAGPMRAAEADADA